MPKLNARRFTLNAKSGLTLIKLLVASHPKLLRRKAIPGLTLIELLVVISIIGILASLATFTYTDSQAKSRDSRRKANIDAIRKALELAKQDSAGAFSYPNCYPSGVLAASCQISANDVVKIGATNLASTYIKDVPLDPKSNGGYWYYTYASDGSTACPTAGNCPRFKLVACLENSKDPQIDPTASQDVLSCPNSGVTAGTKSYTITNL